MPEKIRLQKFLAERGIASRRRAEQFILAGEVTINKKVVKQLGITLDPAKDRVEFRGKLVSSEKEAKQVLMLNKPKGYVCTTRHFKGEKSILDLVQTQKRLYPVGRLDKDSSGLILLTNDGDLALKMTHPRFEKEKEYEVEVNQEIPKDFFDQIKKGVVLPDGPTLPAEAEPLSKKSFKIVLKQGKKRQIRRMVELFGLKVTKLQRVRVNQLKLANLGVGKWRELSEKELKML